MEDEDSRNHSLDSDPLLTRVKAIWDLIQGPVCEDKYSALGVTSSVKGNRVEYTLSMASTNGYCWWSSLLAVNYLKSLTEGVSFDFNSFYAFVWSQVKYSKEGDL